MLLKSQLIQLERQLMILTDALSRRSSLIIEVENSLTAAVDILRGSLMGNEKMQMLKINRSEFEKLLQAVESSRAKLFRDSEVTLIDKVKLPLHAWNQFVRNDRQAETTSLIDICTGNFDHINIRHVSQLETKLTFLYDQLKLVADLLSASGSPHALPETFRRRLAAEVSKACLMLNESNQQLLKLSVLVPAMPLPYVDVLNIKDLTADDIMKAFQKYCKGHIVQKDIQNFVHGLVKTLNHSVSVTEAERKLLVDELKFHCTTYDFQNDFIDSLLKSVAEEYNHFESDLQMMICEPLKEVLSAFDQLKQGTNDSSMHIFFQVLKSHELQLAEIVGKLSIDTSSEERSQVLSQYGKQFLTSMSGACSKQKEKRDRQLENIDSIRAIQDEHWLQFSKVFSDKNVILKTVGKAPSINDKQDELVERKRDSEYSMDQCEKNYTPAGDGLCKMQNKLPKKHGRTKIDSSNVQKKEDKTHDICSAADCECIANPYFVHSVKESRCSEQKYENKTDHLSSDLAKSPHSDNTMRRFNDVVVKLSDNRSDKKKKPIGCKEPVVALSNLTLKQPLKCRLHDLKSSSSGFQTRHESSTALRQLKENSPNS